MNKTLLATGALFGALGIILGAYAAHGLEKIIDSEAVKTFETGVRYQIYHAFFLLIIGSKTSIKKQTKKLIYWLTTLGTICFSGSIYALATNTLSNFDFKSIALITPTGGLLLILAWTVLLIAILTNKTD